MGSMLKADPWFRVLQAKHSTVEDRRTALLYVRAMYHIPLADLVPLVRRSG